MTKNLIKGLDAEALGQMLSGFKADPSAANFQFGSSTNWLSGAAVHSVFSGYRQNGREITRRRPHELGGDEPVALLGGGTHVGPSGHLLHAMSHCLAVTTLHHAAARGVQIDSLRVDAEGALDLQGLLGMNDRVKPGFRHIHVTARIDSPNPPAEVYELFQYAQGRSPICATIRHGVNVEWELDIEATGAGPDTDPVRHGVNYQDLCAVLQAVNENPVLAKCKFYASTEWQGGARVRSTHPGFDQAEGDFLIRHRDEHPKGYVGDEPQALLGSDAGPARFETLLHAMANCVAVTTSYHAAARGIPLDAFQVDIRGDIDLQGLADLDDRVSPAYGNIRARLRTKAGGSDGEIKDLMNFATAHSPMCDSVCQPVHLTFSLVHNGRAVELPAAA